MGHSARNGEAEQATTEQEAPRRASRRSLLRLAGAAAVGTVAAAAHSNTAAAANGQNVVLGANNLGTQTVLRSDANTVHAVLIVDHTTNGTGNGIESTGKGKDTAGVYGGNFNAFGVRGVDPGPLGTGVKGEAPGAEDGWGVWGVGGTYGVYCDGVASDTAIGLFTQGKRSAMRLASVWGTDPRSRVDSHFKGEVEPDGLGNLWVCVVSGYPGTWRRIAGPTTAGAFVPVTPKRVFDSRWAGFGGILTTGTERTVSVADGRDLTTGAVDLANLVPSGTTAIQFTLTATVTTSKGFLAATPGDAATYTASSLNWPVSADSTANTTMTTVDTNRNIKLFCGGVGASTHAIVDIVGYYL